MKFLRNYIIEPFFIHFHYNKKDEKREKKHFFLFIHQNDLFAKYRIDRPSVITGAAPGVLKKYLVHFLGMMPDI